MPLSQQASAMLERALAAKVAREGVPQDKQPLGSWRNEAKLKVLEKHGISREDLGKIAKTRRGPIKKILEELLVERPSEEPSVPREARKKTYGKGRTHTKETKKKISLKQFGGVEGFCKRKHILEGANLYTSPRGAHQCRLCMYISTVSKIPDWLLPFVGEGPTTKETLPNYSLVQMPGRQSPTNPSGNLAKAANSDIRPNHPKSWPNNYQHRLTPLLSTTY